jgi:glycosyltransferase involved in cell wall biosynthesis
MTEGNGGRIAVVHDWLLDYSGAERVLAEIIACFPRADLFALFDCMSEAERTMLGGRHAQTTFLQRMPGIASHHQQYLPLMPFAIEQLDLTGYDLILSSSHAVAKGVIVSPDALDICYIHSPMRYAFDMKFTYLREGRMERGVRGAALRWLLHRLRLWDQASSAGVDHYVAASRFAARRVLKAYRREAQVIYPPVDVELFQPAAEREDYYVTVARFMPFKRVELMVGAFAQLPGRRLVVIGDGPEFNRVKALAGHNVELTGRLAPAAVHERVRRARAFLFASIDDFGIAPVEALAAGTPVIALRRGGVAESVTGLESDSPTGVFFEEATEPAIVAAIRTFEANAGRFSAEACRARAQRFSAQRFREEFSRFVSQARTCWQQGLSLPQDSGTPR